MNYDTHYATSQNFVEKTFQGAIFPTLLGKNLKFYFDFFPRALNTLESCGRLKLRTYAKVWDTHYACV